MKKRDTQPNTLIALRMYEKSSCILVKATEGVDYKVDNMFEANLIALKSLKPSDKFLGISAIINPDHWNYDPSLREYKELNYTQAKNGVVIRRVFLLKDEKELEIMRPIILEQKNNGICASYLIGDNLQTISRFPDFTILPQSNFALYVPAAEKMLTVTVTTDSELIADLEANFYRLESKAQELS